MTRKQIIKKIGNPHLSLHAGKGYFYFVFDKSDREFDERSVYTMRLNDLSLDRWVEEGKELLNEVGAWQYLYRTARHAKQSYRQGIAECTQPTAS